MKILMVCLGNICRSPMAEGILRKKAEARRMNLTVDSAGTAHGMSANILIRGLFSQQKNSVLIFQSWWQESFQ